MEASGCARAAASRARHPAPALLLTIEDVADRLAVSTRTVRRLIEAGELAVHRIGRAVRIAEADLQSYLRRVRG